MFTDYRMLVFCFRNTESECTWAEHSMLGFLIELSGPLGSLVYQRLQKVSSCLGSVGERLKRTLEPTWHTAPGATSLKLWPGVFSREVSCEPELSDQGRSMPKSESAAAFCPAMADTRIRSAVQPWRRCLPATRRRDARAVRTGWPSSSCTGRGRASSRPAVWDSPPFASHMERSPRGSLARARRGRGALTVACVRACMCIYLQEGVCVCASAVRVRACACAWCLSWVGSLPGLLLMRRLRPGHNLLVDSFLCRRTCLVQSTFCSPTPASTTAPTDFPTHSYACEQHVV